MTSNTHPQTTLRFVAIISHDDGTVVGVDPILRSLVVSDGGLALIQQGALFSIDHVDAALADNGDVEILIRTQANQCFIIFGGTFGGNLISRLFEGTTVSANGTVITPEDRNRTTDNTPLTLFNNGPTVTAEGDQISEGLLLGGTKNNISSISGSLPPYILAAGTNYLLRLSNMSGSSIALSALFMFYEIPPDA